MNYIYKNFENIKKIHQLFQMHVNRNPSKIAIKSKSQKITYFELDALSNQCARLFTEKGVKQGSIVVIAANQSVESLIATIGTLKLGAAYVPINLENPIRQIEAVAKDTNASLIFSSNTVIKALISIQQYRFNSVAIDNLQSLLSSYSTSTYEEPENTHDLAYLIRTSGTTGNPKSVMIEHKNLIPTFNSWEKEYSLSNTDIHLQMAPIGFDVREGDWIKALCSGATLVLCPKEILVDSKSLYKIILKENINCAEFVPSTLRNLVAFVESIERPFAKFRLLVCGSDKWSMKEYRHVKKMCGEQTRLISSYGVSEASIDSTYYEELSDEKNLLPNHATVPIGKPFSHVEIAILDDEGNLLNKQGIGEIGISGLGVGIGYFGQQELTLKKFISKFGDKSKRMYLTGDKGALLPNGNFVFYGRDQEYVKKNGKRIDLPSLESTIMEHKKIKFCFISVQKNPKSNEAVIICYFTSSETISFEEIALQIRNELPCYYMPNHFYQVETIPLSQNGKVDRNFVSTSPVKELKPVIVPAYNHIQDFCIGLWKEVLGVTQIGVTNSFFDLGGTSLQWAHMIQNINQKFSLKISPSVSCESILQLSTIIQSKQELSAINYSTESIRFIYKNISLFSKSNLKNPLRKISPKIKKSLTNSIGKFNLLFSRPTRELPKTDKFYFRNLDKKKDNYNFFKKNNFIKFSFSVFFKKK